MKIIDIDSLRLFADSAIVLPDKPLFLPDFADSWTIRLCIAMRVSRLGKDIAPKFAARYYDAFTVCARLIPDKAPDGSEFLFDGAVALGQWIQPDKLPESSSISLNGTEIATISDLRPDADNAIVTASRYATMKMGDIIILRALPCSFPVSVGTDINISLAGFDTVITRIR